MNWWLTAAGTWVPADENKELEWRHVIIGLRSFFSDIVMDQAASPL
jgi:hypothetical protein